jgi:hypothetical protein
MKKQKKIDLLGIKCGITFFDNGFYFSFPLKGISLNKYRKMHFGEIKKLRKSYVNFLELILDKCIKKEFLKFNDKESRIELKSPLFFSKINVDWVLSFRKKIVHDPSNYSQKILMDAINDVGIVKDDSDDYISKDSTQICNVGVDQIECYLYSDFSAQLKLKMFKKSFLDGDRVDSI